MRPTFFDMPVEAKGFDHSLTEIISALKRGAIAGMIAEENIHQFSHGRRWNHRTETASVSGEMQVLSVEWQFPFQEIVDGDLNLIPRIVEHLTKEMHTAQMRMIYGTLSEICDANGQTVSAAEMGSNAQAFLELLRRVEFGVDRHGNVSMPELHAAASTAETIIADLEAQPPEFVAEVERIKAEKTLQALAREKERLGRFKKAQIA